MATRSFHSIPWIGFVPSATTNGTLSLNAANTWLSFGWVQKETKTLNEIMLYCSAINGTQGNITCSNVINGDNAGVPDNSAIAGTSTSTINAGSWPAGGNFVTFTGFNCTLTAGTRYHQVIKNLSAVPGTDRPTFLYAGGAAQIGLNLSKTGWGFSKIHTTDAGTTWGSSPIYNVLAYRLGFSDGTYAGMPISDVSDAGNVYSAYEYGSVFTSPANVRLNVIGLNFLYSSVSSPTGTARARLYNGVTLQRTSQDVVASVIGNRGTDFYFSSVYVVEPSQTIRFVLSETSQADAVANRFTISKFNFENSVATRTLMPFGGTMQATYTTDSTASPVVFTDVNTSVCPGALLLDPSNPFEVIASGGGGSKLLDGGLIR